MCSCIQPCKSSSQCLYSQFLIFQEYLIDSGNFILSTSRRLNGSRHFYHLIGIKIQTRHRIIALGMLRLLLDGDGVELIVELDDAEAFIKLIGGIVKDKEIGGTN